VHRALGATLQALYACSPGRCPAFRGQALTFLFVELTYRLFRCGRCAALVLVCRKCDHGYRYCSEECSKEARRQKHARAQADYQRVHHEQWRVAHRAQQRCFRDRERRRTEPRKQAVSGVTDQSLASPATPINVAAHALPATDDNSEWRVDARFRHQSMVCMFCGRILAPFAGSSTLRWSG